MPVSAASIRKAILKAKSALGTLLIDVDVAIRTPKTYVPGQSAGYNEEIVKFQGFIAAYKAEEIDGTMIKVGDIKLNLFTGSAIPQPDDVATANTVRYRIMKNAPIYVGSEIVLHVLQARPA